MLQFISEEISLRLVANKIISIDNRKYYTYGIELVLNDLLIGLSIALTAVLTNKVVMSLAYCLTYCPLRSYVGGHHCKTCFRCYCTTMTLYFTMLILNEFLAENKMLISCILIGIAVPLILLFAPVDYGNDPLDNAAKRKYHVKSIAMAAASVAVFILACAFHKAEISFAISWGVFMVFSLMLVSVISNSMEWRRKKDDKKTDA